jgi:hypothetical protein
VLRLPARVARQHAAQATPRPAVSAKAAAVAEARGKLEAKLFGADAKLTALKNKVKAKKALLKGKDPLTAGFEVGEAEAPPNQPQAQSSEPPAPVGATCPAGMVREMMKRER